MESRTALLLLLLLAATGCRGTEPGDRISRERFVAANVALRTLPEDAAEEQRAAVLERYRVSSEDLHRWVEHHADEPAVLAAAWQEVAARLDSLADPRPEPFADSPDSLAIGPPPPPPGVHEEPEKRVPDFAEEMGVPRPPQPTGTRARDLRVPSDPPPKPEMVEIQ